MAYVMTRQGSKTTLQVVFITLVAALSGALLLATSERSVPKTGHPITSDTSIPSIQYPRKLDLSEWRVYEDKEIGVTFEYPKGYVITPRYTANEMYKGSIYTIQIQDNNYTDVMWLTAASPEFAPYISESSPITYADEPLYTSQSLDKLTERIESKFFMLALPKKVTFGKITGIEGYVATYGRGTSIYKTTIVPLQHALYSNLTVYGDPIVWLPTKDGLEYKEELRYWTESFDKDFFATPIRDRIVQSMKWQ